MPTKNWRTVVQRTRPKSLQFQLQQLHREIPGVFCGIRSAIWHKPSCCANGFLIWSCPWRYLWNTRFAIEQNILELQVTWKKSGVDRICKFWEPKLIVGLSFSCIISSGISMLNAPTMGALPCWHVLVVDAWGFLGFVDLRIFGFVGYSHSPPHRWVESGDLSCLEAFRDIDERKDYGGRGSNIWESSVLGEIPRFL